MSAHICVWVDHREAKIFHVTAEEAEASHVMEHGPQHHLHRRADHVGQGKTGLGAVFMDEIAAALEDARAILVLGPGSARTELKSYLDAKHPALAKKVWDVLPADHPSDAQIVATARSYFHAEERMR